MKSCIKYLVHSLVVVGTLLSCEACQKTGTIPNITGTVAITVVNAIPQSAPIIPVFNTTLVVEYFINAINIGYGNYYEYSVPGSMDSLYAVQFNSDTAELTAKSGGLMFSGILPLKTGFIYSLFLTGGDTSASDYLLTTDSLPIYSSTDSVMGIRFVNLSTGSNPISINLEGGPDGSEIASLPYKGITSFKQYPNSSTTQDYFFVIRDAATGDSLTQFDFAGSGSQNNGYGWADVTNNNYGHLLTFKNITIALIGQPGTSAAVPQSTMIIDDY